jgi:hypothetical protein
MAFRDQDSVTEASAFTRRAAAGTHRSTVALELGGTSVDRPRAADAGAPSPMGVPVPERVRPVIGRLSQGWEYDQVGPAGTR